MPGINKWYMQWAQPAPKYETHPIYFAINPPNDCKGCIISLCLPAPNNPHKVLEDVVIFGSISVINIKGYEFHYKIHKMDTEKVKSIIEASYIAGAY